MPQQMRIDPLFDLSSCGVLVDDLSDATSGVRPRGRFDLRWTSKLSLSALQQHAKPHIGPDHGTVICPQPCAGLVECFTR
jgi:hypothetical protein